MFVIIIYSTTANMAVRNAFGGNSLQLRGFRPKNASFFHSKPSFRPWASVASFPRANRNPGPQMKAPWQSVFCTLCGVTLNSEIQSQQHFNGKAHLSRVELCGAGSQYVDSGSGQFAATQADTVKNQVHQHFRGQLRPTKRAAEVTHFNPRPKIPRLPNAATQYRCTLPYLSKELQYKTPLAMLYEYKNGLVINVSNRQGTSHDPLYTASLQLDGKTFRANGNSKRRAQQLLAEVVISQMEHGIEQMLEKRAAVKQSIQNMNENGEQPSIYDQKPIQISTPSNAAVHSNYEHFDFTSNDDLYCSAAFNAFDSTTTDSPTSNAKVGSGITTHSEQSSGADEKLKQASAPLNVAASESTTAISASNSKVVSSGISQPQADFTMFGPGADNADSYRTLSAPEKVKLASANIIASASDVKPDPKSIIAEDTIAASGSKILIPAKKDQQKTAFATLKFLRPGLKWMVKCQSAESPSEEFGVDLYVDGETFSGCSSVKLLARQYAAEAALVKLFSLEFERGLDGMPLFKGSFDEIAHLIETKEDDSSLDIDGKNPISLLHELFNNEVVFQFHSREASEWGPQHCCTVSVAGMSVEGLDTVKKTAKKRAAFAAVSALKASGLYDRKVAAAEARHASMPAQQPMMKYGSVLSRIVEVKSKGGTPLLPTPDVPPISIHPVTKFPPRPETQNAKGRGYAIAGRTGGKSFLGRGMQTKPVQANAAQNALRGRGRGRGAQNALQGRGRGRGAQNALQGRGRGRGAQNAFRGRGRGGTLRGNKTGNNVPHVNSSFCDSVPQKVASLMNSVQSPVAHSTLPVRGQGRGRAASGIERGNGILNVSGNNFDTGNIEIGAFGRGIPHPRGQVRPTTSRITFVGSRGRAVPGIRNNINSRLLAMSCDAKNAVSRVSDFDPAVNENGYEFSSFGSSFNADDPYGSPAMHYSFSGPPCHISSVPGPRLERGGFSRAHVRGPGWGRGFRFNAAFID